MDGVYFADDNDNSESTDPLKIEPSINLVFTAEEMHPIGEKDYDNAFEDPMQSDLSPNRDRVLPSEEKLNKSNIFEQDESELGLGN